ncbi:hypothetical protein [Saccharospirillum salsuginis]|uniref:Uncharacterized protein n=1 Tax=Saccharospirillum salsuginis TaxID=418750 RepID=A0A918KCA2_9GAMM|nr:hypothetical protein [Saccharospirillum salsuginis]GGX58367.1 hypothetical protein GCM10007392_27760 [Saccharospirillum salsuginis]
MVFSRKAVWSGVVLVVVLLGSSAWGVAWYQAKQEREVLAPQRLLDHLASVRAGQAELMAEQIAIDGLKPVEIARIRSALRADLETSAHPDPEAAAERLLSSATAHLDSDEGTVAALERWLRRNAETDWQPLDQQPDRWLVRAGEACLELMFQSDEPEVTWRWVAVSDCPVETG